MGNEENYFLDFVSQDDCNDILKPIELGNVINIDQGCKIDGRLSAWELGKDNFYQVLPQEY